MRIDDDKVVQEMNEALIGSTPGPIFLAIDTFEGLKKIYNDEISLKLTEIICNNYYKEKELELKAQKLEEV